MKFLANKRTIFEAVSIAQEIISTKNSGSAFSNILFILKDNTIYIKATDVKINYEAKILAQIFEEGCLTVYCNKFIEILNSLPDGEIEVFQKNEDDDEKINVSKNSEYKKNEFINIIIKPVVEKIRFQMKTTIHKKFADFSFENIPYFEISSKDLKNMIVQTLFAVSTDEMRYFMNGVFFEKKDNDLVLVATDGRRLSFISKPILANIDNFPPIIVHPKILNMILKYAPEEGNIFIAIVEKNFFCKFSNYEFSVALLEGQFPNYSRVIPKKQSFVFYVKKTDLANALARHISLMVDKKIGRIYFNLSDNVLKITSLQPDVGSVDEEIPCKFLGESCTFAFNFDYIEEPVKEINTEMIAFEFTEEMKAVTMRPEPAQDYFHIIMPMQKE